MESVSFGTPLVYTRKRLLSDVHVPKIAERIARGPRSRPGFDSRGVGARLAFGGE